MYFDEMLAPIRVSSFSEAILCLDWGRPGLPLPQRPPRAPSLVAGLAFAATETYWRGTRARELPHQSFATKT